MSLKTRPIGGGHLQPVIIAQRDELPPVPVETRSGESVDVFIQDQTTPPLDLYFVQAIGVPTTLAVQAAINDRNITVASDAGFSVGDYLGLFTAPRFYFGEVLAKPGGNVLTLDTPIDFAYTAGSHVQPLTRDLNVNGSVGSPQIFFVAGPGAGSFEIDITRIMISMITSSAADLSLFGNLAALTNGITLRKTDSETRNIWNAKTNLDLLNLAYDLTIFQASNPSQGVDGLGCRYSFAGQEKHGVAVRLGTNEQLQIVITDNLSTLTQFRIIASGHIVAP